MSAHELDLEKLKPDILNWLSVRQRGVKMPEQLWDGAVKLTAFLGLAKVCKKLGLDFYQVREWGQRL